ncbi:MAG: 3-deoxy-D-manno-octulosonic acid kinase [Gemmatimonadaceae bacterium]|nr:3-deoxy-D-manno-octulosonic acid kinase [Gemmatimonadaceae bacterium]
MIGRVPPGYSSLRLGQATAVAQDGLVSSVREALGAGTLYDYAAAHPERRELAGRKTAFAVPLPGGGARVVVRRSHHGGLLAAVTGDLFLPPTRAPYELLVSLLLIRAGIPTPPVLAYAVYHAGPILRRSDVVTLELHGDNLATVLTQNSGIAWVEPVADLLRDLARTGAWHPDLNLRNILLSSDDAGNARAWILDVDRIRFHPPGDPNVRSANHQRLDRSLRKWSRQATVALDPRVLGDLRRLAMAS